MSGGRPAVPPRAPDVACGVYASADGAMRRDLVVVRALGFVEETEDPYDIRTENLAFFLGAHYLVTVHAARAPAVSEVEEQMRRSPELLSRGAERLMHASMDTAIDAYPTSRSTARRTVSGSWRWCGW